MLHLSPDEIKEVRVQEFHFSYFEKEGDLYSKGITIKAADLISAIALFNDKVKGVTPFCIHNKTIIGK